RILQDIDDIKICRLTAADVVRHVLVQRIIEAYEKHENKRAQGAPKPAATGKAPQRTYKKKAQ
ncbi:MAG: PhoH family protein, partial [Oscillospiraceae bacterium]